MITTVQHEEARAKFKSLAGVLFKNEELLIIAFTHRSYLNEARAAGGAAPRAHNERMEFLGDAVLELAVTDALFRAYPEKSEGELTSFRAALVNATMLGGIAEGLGMNECLLLSRGEAKDTGRARLSILANTLEAVIGALYLDQGFTSAQDFVARHVMTHISEVIEEGSFKDAKSKFQEFSQEKYGITPSYETLTAEGPDHDKRFVVSVSVGGVVVAEGEGKSKQEAEQAAARKALEEK